MKHVKSPSGVVALPPATMDNSQHPLRKLTKSDWMEVYYAAQSRGAWYTPEEADALFGIDGEGIAKSQDFSQITITVMDRIRMGIEHKRALFGNDPKWMAQLAKIEKVIIRAQNYIDGCGPCTTCGSQCYPGGEGSVLCPNEHKHPASPASISVELALLDAIADIGTQDIYTDARQYSGRVSAMRSLCALLGRLATGQPVSTADITEAIALNEDGKEKCCYCGRVFEENEHQYSVLGSDMYECIVCKESDE